MPLLSLRASTYEMPRVRARQGADIVSPGCVGDVAALLIRVLKRPDDSVIDRNTDATFTFERVRLYSRRDTTERPECASDKLQRQL
jgi:hypothetical protein